jgi:hypothetical protein
MLGRPMPAVSDIAADHARFRRGLALAVADDAARAWRAVDPKRITQTWLGQLVRLTVLLTGAQRAAANRADSYLDEVLDAQGINPAAAGRVVVPSLAGVASDGRTLEGLLYRPALTALSGISRGATVDRAMAGGGAVLDMIVRTQVADAGRAADHVAMVARPQATGYVRMLVGKSCSRCALLAGRRYTWKADFDRHPRCDCTAVPAREDTADDVRTDPRRYFGSLSAAEQDRQFTKAGAEAIRRGADIGQVVNARSGMYTAGGRLLTRTAATSRGVGGVRLMPEQILRDAAGDRGEAIRLLKRFGFLQ